MSRRKRNQERHVLDSSQWSATRAARRLVTLRDEALERIPENPVIRDIFAAEFHNLHSQYQERFRQQGHGEVAASLLASSELWSSIPVTGPESFKLMAQERQEYLRSTLEEASLYVLSPPMYNTLCAAAASLNRGHLRYWSHEDLLSPAGLLLFPRIQPYVLASDTDVPEELIGISWLHDPTPIRVGEGEDERICTSLHSTVWIDIDGPVESPEFTMLVGMAAEMGHPYPRLLPVANSELTLGIGDSDSREVYRDTDKWEVHLPAASNVEVPGEYQQDDILSGIPVGDWALQFLMSFMRMSRSKTVTNEEYRRGAPAEMTAKSRPHHDVHVVSLASYETERGEIEGDPSTKKSWAYSVRFPVQVHPVRQWYPREGRHKVIFRGPFLKGPKDAPLLDRSKRVYKA